MDPLDLGARLAQLLATGRRVATYKLATLDALIQHCLENPVPDDAGLTVPIGELADRVIEVYWPQVRVFGEHGVLRQNEQARDGSVTLTDAVAELRRSAERQGLSTAPQFRSAAPAEWARFRRRLSITLAQQPLFALQRTGGREPGVAFLYDDSWLSKKVTIATLDAHDWSIDLLPGVPSALARVSAMLQPVVRQWWVEDVQRLNQDELELPDLHAFLFGAQRTAVDRLADGLREYQANRCYYCHRTLTREVHVDHVLPWSRVPLDGVRNLVLTDPRCNGDKLATLPAVDHVRDLLTRPEADLQTIAAPLRWPVETARVRGAAVGLYRAATVGSPLWREPGLYDFFDGHIAW